MQASNGCKDFAMWSLWTLYICLAVAVSIGRSDGPKGQGFSSVRVEALLAKMTLEDKIGQMTQIDISVFVSPETGKLDEQKLTGWISRYRIGSLFNTPFAGHAGSWTASKWRGIIRRAQQIASGSGSKLPLLIGLDSVHGANYVEGAVLFPQQIALAATFNPKLAGEAGRIAARDSRAAAVPWLFSPILGLATQPLWPRVYETFGEDPHLASEMGAALIKGIQSSQEWGGNADDGEPLRAAACMKHFVGYSHPTSGHDRSPSRIPEQELLEVYLPPFQAAVKAGVSSAMESYNELNGTPVASSRRYLIDVLRGRLGFLGMLVTDYAEIMNLEFHHGVSGGAEQSVQMAMEDTSIDMSMVPLDASFAEILVGLVRGGQVSRTRIERSVRRILALKESLGLLDSPVPAAQSPLLGKVGGEDDQNAALQAARESITLLKNGEILTKEKDQTGHVALPLDRTKIDKLLVVGPACHSLSLQSGGWTNHWQGALNEDEFSPLAGRTILQGIQGLIDGSLASGDREKKSPPQKSHSTVKVVYKRGIRVDGTNDKDRDDALSEAFSADAIVACVGESAFAEKKGDLTQLELPSGVASFVKELRKVSDNATPIILALVEGRPRLLGDIPAVADAVLHTYLPGPSGGQAVAEILFGETNPSGRLPITYPRHSGNIPLPYHRPVSDRCQLREGEGECAVQWWFGEGLSYTKFRYTSLEVEPSTITEGQKFWVSLLVNNVGVVKGDDSILLFATHLVRKVTPRYKLLKGFQKVSLDPGQSEKVKFELTWEDLEYIGEELRPVLESGVILFGVGPEADCRVDPDSCAALTVTVSGEYQPSCSAACDLWYPRDDAAPGGYVCPREARDAFRDKQECLDECIQAQWGWGYVSCIEQAVWTGTCAFNQQCRAVGSAKVLPSHDGHNSGATNSSSSMTNIGGGAAARPRTGSVDLALGVAVGMCIGGAAVFVVLMRNRRFQTVTTRRGSTGFGHDGVRLHGGRSQGVKGRGGGVRWPYRRPGFPGGGGKATNAKQVAIELGRGGFDFDGEEEAFAALPLDRNARDLQQQQQKRNEESSEGLHRETSSGGPRAGGESLLSTDDWGRGRESSWRPQREERLSSGVNEALLSRGRSADSDEDR